MNKSVLGIDLGTSSVKVLQRFENGAVVKSRAAYEEISPKGWWAAICQVLSELDLSSVDGISLSSQVGTYIINDCEVISWNEGAGAEELNEIKERYPTEIFVKEISMAHPNIVSYPIPRLKYIGKYYDKITSVCQPKDYICEQLTGKRVTDPYSWRGLANLEREAYSRYFLNELGIDEEKLPQMQKFIDLAGYTKEIQLPGKVLPAGIPVYTGLNDYYASLLGMGIQGTGDLFDISGTSEHLGVVEEDVNVSTELVSGPYLNHCVHYGVTASSGASVKFGLKLSANGAAAFEMDKIMKGQPPIFLPYLNGERAPIWDADARGVYFGLSECCSMEELAYAAFEGVVFSLYHIYETMGRPKAERMLISGGAAVFPALNRLKAEMFGIPAVIPKENDTSALGAAMIAAVGAGWYPDFQTAIAKLCSIKEKIEPTGKYREWLEKRFSVYKELYPALKLQYERLKEIRT